MAAAAPVRPARARSTMAACARPALPSLSAIARTRADALPPRPNRQPAAPGAPEWPWLTHDMLHRSVVDYASAAPGAVGQRLIAAVMRRAHMGAPVRIAVLGGSMTAGMNSCGNAGRGRPPCLGPWSERLKHHFQRSGLVNVTVVNLAYGGRHSMALWAARPLDAADVSFDLVLVDFAVNDAPRVTGDDDLLARDPLSIPLALELINATKAVCRAFLSRGIAVAFVETFFVPVSAHSREHWTRCDKEAAASRPNTLFSFICRASDAALARANAMHRSHQEMVAPTAARHGLPIASYRDAVWPTPVAVPPVPFWSNSIGADPQRQDPHPSWEVHQMVADVVWYNWQVWLAAALCANANASSQEGVPPQQQVDQAMDATACRGPLQLEYSASAGRAAAFPPAHSGRHWRFYEDRPGKPGWIGELDGGAAAARPVAAARSLLSWLRGERAAAPPPGPARRLSFVVPCADVMTLEVLRTYDANGRAEVAISRPLAQAAAARLGATGEPPTGGVALSEWGTWWDQPVSLLQPVWIRANGSFACPPAPRWRLLTITLQPPPAAPQRGGGAMAACKVKIATLRVCAL